MLLDSNNRTILTSQPLDVVYADCNDVPTSEKRAPCEDDSKEDEVDSIYPPSPIRSSFAQMDELAPMSRHPPPSPNNNSSHGMFLALLPAPATLLLYMINSFNRLAYRLLMLCLSNWLYSLKIPLGILKILY